jgi:hypothetical protein
LIHDRAARALRKVVLLVAFLLTAALIAVAQNPAAALCIPPMEVTGALPEVAVNHRYAWFLIESLRYARTAWQEADNALDSQHPVVKLADLKLAVEDFQCAASLVQTFQGVQGPDEYTTEAIRASAAGATRAYTTFAAGFQRSVTALARSEGLPLEIAADIRVQNQKAGELLIAAAEPAWFALLRPPPDPKALMDRLTLTRDHRAALLEGLKRRGFRAAPNTDSPDTHSPHLAAAVLYKGLSNPQYKAVDEP